MNKTGLRSKILRQIERVRFRIERDQWQRDPIKWREKHPLMPVDDDMIVYFFIPIFEKKRAPDWSVVSANLSRTLAALLRQTDPRWRAIICSQDRPDCELPDPRIEFIRYSVSHGGGSDKEEKMRHMARTLARRERRDSYVFFLDGDDIPHPRLVEFILNDNNGRGYYLPEGYGLDLRSGDVFHYSDEPAIDYSFSRTCGSSHAVRFDARRDMSQVLHVALRGPHGKMRENMISRFGIDMKPVPFPAMVYTINHGTSDQDIIQSGRGLERKIGGRRLEDHEGQRTLDLFVVADLP